MIVCKKNFCIAVANIPLFHISSRPIKNSENQPAILLFYTILKLIYLILLIYKILYNN